MFLKKLAGKTDIEDALQRLENVTLEESRMTGAEALRAIHDVSNKVGDNTDKMRDALQAVHDKVGGVEGMLQGVTEMLQGVSDKVQGVGDKVQGVDDREKDISDEVINGTQIVQLVMYTRSLSTWLGVEETGRRTENHFDTMTEEGLEGVRDRPVEVDKVPSAVKDIGSRSISGEGVQLFSNKSSTPSLSVLYAQVLRR